jgi:hypothetical protein
MNTQDYLSKSNYSTKQRIQQLVYPEGISFSKEKEECRTIRENEVMKLITSISKELSTKKEGTQSLFCDESLSVDSTDIFSNSFIQDIQILSNLNCSLLKD